MKKFIRNKLKDQKGLTLIELLAVIVIIAIIAAIAIPAIGNIIQNSRENALVSDAQNVLSAANIYFADNPTEDTFTNSSDGVEGYLETTGEITAFSVTNTTPLEITFTGSAGNTVYTDIEATATTLANDGREIFGD